MVSLKMQPCKYSVLPTRKNRSTCRQLEKNIRYYSGIGFAAGRVELHVFVEISGSPSISTADPTALLSVKHR
jgi:hypothetical protein